jgi:DNA-binding CsgD family transcriptional regulator
LSYHARLEMPFERARTLLLLGQLHRRRRHKPAASLVVAEAVRIFDDIGAAVWACRAREEQARLAGGDVAHLTLTPAEERVARRAADGLSNKEIAAELFLAPKTVEMNLSSAYRKLGIRSRAQLHTRLVDAGDD